MRRGKSPRAVGRGTTPLSVGLSSFPCRAPWGDGAQQGAVALSARAGYNCIGPLTSSSLEGQSSLAYSAEMCFYSGIMGHVHT